MPVLPPPIVASGERTDGVKRSISKPTKSLHIRHRTVHVRACPKDQAGFGCAPNPSPFTQNDKNKQELKI